MKNSISKVDIMGGYMGGGFGGATSTHGGNVKNNGGKGR